MKRIISICIILLLLALSITADTGWKDISVWYGATITVNGTPLSPTDANGTAAPPIVIDGTVYLPARAIVEALGGTIAWDSTNKVAAITYSEQSSKPIAPVTPAPIIPVLATPAPVPPPVVGGATYDFPFHLYSDDEEYNYLGKLVTDEYDRDGVWNKYSKYGGDYGSYSIWNKYSDYGGDYGRYSAFNKYALNPPLIVDDSGEFYGYLTEDIYKTGGYTIFELYSFLIDNGQ